MCLCGFEWMCYYPVTCLLLRPMLFLIYCPKHAKNGAYSIHKQINAYSKLLANVDHLNIVVVGKEKYPYSINHCFL